MVKVKSYANIAIVKYWGKKDAEKMIPATSSISLTLNDMFTETEMEFIKDKDIKTAVEKEIKNGNYKDKFSNMTDLFYLNGELQDKVHTEKISKVVDLFRENRSQKVKISTTNNMPTAAGLSSSSSGLSAVIKACNELFGKNYAQSELAQISKFGSGSSSRSFFGPIAAWDKDTGEIYEVKTDLKLAMIVLVLNENKKKISSRNGMELCAKTSTYFDEWVKQSEIDFINMKKYLAENDFEKVGTLTEENALRMHKTTETANPPFSYFNEKTYEAMDFVKNLRNNGEKCYFTMDAGPNVKVLCLEEDLEKLAEIFGQKYKIIVSKTVKL
ncbi:diphosphomevalonate decarboxylase [Leptotrichia sp. oral taxon 417]|jgi:diphosphomevalonate decarboxylase|uniref:diphosphomevalonate decarboxylase n=1 Tax=Leptotrichia sp. oral taxon 417 TaxID=712365 RepID=UPI0015C0ABC5|nr:diphosphomevalonate decarboxylase [Leptotrichia sp. oral taxon 417]NWO26293.1 diphosphomevalonate decarboxylase [Leptotrichia sp. oral taxon 417]